MDSACIVHVLSGSTNLFQLEGIGHMYPYVFFGAI